MGARGWDRWMLGLWLMVAGAAASAAASTASGAAPPPPCVFEGSYFDAPTFYPVTVTLLSPTSFVAELTCPHYENCTEWLHANGTIAGSTYTLSFLDGSMAGITWTGSPASYPGNYSGDECETINWSAVGVVVDNWLRPMASIERVHLVFMCHLDVGFTLPTIDDVLEEYFGQYFPAAANTSTFLRARGGAQQFKWTSHPWLLWQMLTNATGTVNASAMAAIETAIAEGAITWHAGAFNLNAEVADPSLYDFGLTLAASLDKRFGYPRKRTASQKDVPGATVGVIDAMVRSGVRALHVGINDFTNPPALPFATPALYAPVMPFRWRNPATGAELIVMWASGYSRPPWGGAPELIVLVPGAPVALALMMMVDNQGPQDVDVTLIGWDNMQAVFPNADIEASSFDAFLDELEPHVDALPVVEGEIGDVWVHGTASATRKMKLYREAARQRAAALAAGTVRGDDPRMWDFSQRLLKVPEHTYGYNNMPLWLANYSNAFFDANYTAPSFQACLLSFTDQAAVVPAAVAALGSLPLRASIEAAWAALEPRYPNLTEWTAWLHPIGASLRIGDWTLALDSAGAIVRLSSAAAELADSEHPLSRFRYVTHSETQFTEYLAGLLRGDCAVSCDGCGYSKCNASLAGAVAKDWTPRLHRAWRRDEHSDSVRLLVELHLPGEAVSDFGAPPVVFIETHLRSDGATRISARVTVQYFDKPPTRLPESLWVSFEPRVRDPRDWRISKMGLWLSPDDVVANGSRVTHAQWDGVRNAGLEIRAPDTPIVGVGFPSPIVYLGDSPAQPEGGMHFCIFNNAWSTNYPLWSLEPDERLRFELDFDAKG